MIPTWLAIRTSSSEFERSTKAYKNISIPIENAKSNLRRFAKCQESNFWYSLNFRFLSVRFHDVGLLPSSQTSSVPTDSAAKLVSCITVPVKFTCSEIQSNMIDSYFNIVKMKHFDGTNSSGDKILPFGSPGKGVYRSVSPNN